MQIPRSSTSSAFDPCFSCAKIIEGHVDPLPLGYFNSGGIRKVPEDYQWIRTLCSSSGSWWKLEVIRGLAQLLSAVQEDFENTLTKQLEIHGVSLSSVCMVTTSNFGRIIMTSML